MAFAGVGSPVHSNNISALTLTPSAVGNFILVEVVTLSSADYATALTSSNATWSVLVSHTTTPADNYSATVFIGKVTSTATATVTITFNVTPAAWTTNAQEFSTTAGYAAVTLDASAVTGSTATTAYPSITPAHGSGELYYCYAFNDVSASAGSTPGYTYYVDSNLDGMCYDASCTSSAQAPVWADSNKRNGVAVLLYEVPVPIVQVIQQASGSAVTSYGIGTTLMTSAGTQSSLVLFAGWNYGVAGTFVTTPAISVSDSAGNLWKQVAITQGGTTVAGNTRSGIWMTVNALPVTWVSVGLTGYTTTAEWLIAEIAGLPQNISIDYSIGVNSFGTAPSLTGIATGSDIGLAVIESGYLPSTVTGPAGWTALGTVTAGTTATGGVMTCYWNPVIAAGTATYTGTISGVPGSASSYSYALCAISASSSPPAQYDIRHPLIVTEAAFGATPGNLSSSVDYTYDSSYVYWTDISTRVIGDAVQARISASGGRQYELQQEESGEMTVMLDNHDGAFTPVNPASPFYSNALNSNMSFQLGVSPWTPRNTATLGVTSGTAWATGLNAQGTQAALVTAGAGATPGIGSDLVPVNANYPYSASAWLYGGTAWATGAQVGIAWYKADKSTVISTSLSSAVALPAGQWTQYSMGGSVPPSGAAWAQEIVQLSGTPGAGFTFGVAEAALTTGSSGTARTGLVALKTPVRVTAWWQGRQWPVWMGYAERWPQSWPEMPQWGFSKLTATDAISVTSTAQMNSALIGEVLIDNPVAYLPCSEQYTTANVGATPQFQFLFGTSPYFAPSDANGLIALNKALNNQVTGTYADGNSQQAATGLAMNFFGDNGTGMGATGYQGEVRGQRGPSMVYSDPALVGLLNSAGGYTIEFWFTWGGSANQDVSLLTLYGTPSAYWNALGQGNGAFIDISITGGNLFLYVNNGGNFLAGTVVPSSNPQHVVYTAPGPAGGTAQIYLNGQIPGAEGGISVAATTPLSAIVLGPGRYSYDCNNSAVYSAFNFSAGHLAAYSYQLTPQRIFSHYQTGVQGWSGVGAAQRFAQILTWGQMGLKRGGYYTANATGVPEITQIGPAYSLSGASANDAVNAVSQSEGGQFYVARDGTLTYLERVISYNQPTEVTFGDNATSAPDVLNSNPGFQFGSIAGWTASGGNISYTGMQFQGVGSLLLAPTGAAPATAYSPAASASGGVTYTAGAWLFSPSGGTFAAGVTFYSGTAVTSSGSHSLIVPPSSWVFTGGTVPAPAGAGITSASMFVTGNPAVIISYGFLMRQSAEIPYQQNTEFDFDDTYLYNEVTATQANGPNQLIIADNRSISSQRQYFRRSTLSFQSDVVSPYDVNDITTWSAAQFAQPVIHASAIGINASADPMVIFPAVLGLDIGSIVQVFRRPVGGAVISELGIIERKQYDIGSRYFYITYQLSPYQPANEVLCADTPGFNTPGTTILGW